MINYKAKRGKRALIFMACLALLMAVSVLAITYDKKVSATTLKKSDIFLPDSNIVSMEENIDAPDWSQAANGVKITTKGDSAKFSYKNLVNVSSFNINTNIIQFQALSDVDMANITMFELILTDSVDESNKFSVVSFPVLSHSSDIGYSSYVRVRYKGMDRGFGEGKLHNGVYGAVDTGRSSYHHLWKGSPKKMLLFNIRLDHETKGVYIYEGKRIVLDLDDGAHVGKPNLWEGFKSGLAKVSVNMTFDNATADGGIIVTQFLGHDLSSTIAEKDKVVPTMELKCDADYAKSMPIGGINEPYPIPTVLAQDWYDGVTEADVKIFDASNVDVTANYSNKKFTPKTVGTHTIRFSKTSTLGKTNSLELPFDVQKCVPTCFMSLKTGNEPILFSNYSVPVVYVGGGSGKLTKTEELTINNIPIKFDSSRMIFIDKVGILQLKVTVRGYTGADVVKIFSFEILSVDLNPLISNVPKALVKGKTITLSDFEVYDKNLSDKGITKNIIVDGVKLGADRTFKVTKNAGETVEIKYVYSKKDVTDSKTFTAPVINGTALSDFILTSDELAITTDKKGTNIACDKDFGFKLAYPISAAELPIRFSVTKPDFGYMDIAFSDSLKDGAEGFLRISPKDNISSYLQINGEGKKYTVSGSFYTLEQFNFVVNSYNGAIFESAGGKICDFMKFPSNSVFISFKVCEVTDNSAISLMQISNQMFVSIAFARGDKASPIITFDEFKEDITEIKLNETFNTFSATAYDVLDFTTTITLEVVSPKNKVLYSGEAKDMSFVAELNGFYTLAYTAKDGLGNTATLNILYNVIDTAPPTLTVESDIPDMITQNTKYVFPAYTAIDVFDKDVRVSIIVTNLVDYSKILITNNEFIFENLGQYKIEYIATDDAFNSIKKEFNVYVVAK